MIGKEPEARQSAAKAKPMPRTCPICNKDIKPEDEQAPHRPFCSPRCKTVDLGGWLTGAYRISRPAAEEDLDEGGLSPGSSGGGRASDDDDRDN